jgi:putative alpha-1,2-mannosidase
MPMATSPCSTEFTSIILLGAPWKAQNWARTTMNKLLRHILMGFGATRTHGQTSAWYVFSALGIYPVCPGQPEYIIGSPLFDKVTLHLENGNNFEMTATDNEYDNYFIQMLH